jgi:hypothetical protein
MAIVNAQLTLSRLDVLTVPAGKTYAVTNILVCNTDETNAASFDMHLIPSSGGGLNDKVTKVINNLTLPASETFTFDSERIVLEEGDILSFKASPDLGSGLTDLAATVSYLEV